MLKHLIFTFILSFAALTVANAQPKPVGEVQKEQEAKKEKAQAQAAKKERTDADAGATSKINIPREEFEVKHFKKYVDALRTNVTKNDTNSVAMNLKTLVDFMRREMDQNKIRQMSAKDEELAELSNRNDEMTEVLGAFNKYSFNTNIGGEADNEYHLMMLESFHTIMENDLVYLKKKAGVKEGEKTEPEKEAATKERAAEAEKEKLKMKEKPKVEEKKGKE